MPDLNRENNNEAFAGSLDDELLEQEYDRLESYSETADYYDLLALPRDPPPTDSQISSAYRNLTLSFHPDKQPPHLRDVATAQFDRIKTAYDTLIDPKKRVVYDMLGEDGVKAGWSAGGPIRHAEQNEVGVKSMDKEQFRRWFLISMKKRELKAVEDMVQSHSTLLLGVDASDTIYKLDMDDDEVYLRVPSPKFNSLLAGFNYKTPFSPLGWIYSLRKDEENPEDDTNGPDMDNLLEAEIENTQLELHTGVGGNLQQLKQKITLFNPETEMEEEREVPMQNILLGDNLSLGANLRHVITEPLSNARSLNKLLFPFLGDSVLDVRALLLPSPILATTVSKSISLIPKARPLNVTVQTNMSSSLRNAPPVVNLSVSKQVGANKLIFYNWSSGQLWWPPFISRLLEKGTANDKDEVIAISDKMSSFELGFMALPRRKKAMIPTGHGEEEEDLLDEAGNVVVDTKGEPLESWGFQLHTSPMNLQLSASYSRNLFATGVEEPAVSEWNYEGHLPTKRPSSNRPVRLEIKTTMGVDLSLGWSVAGTRKVGEYTHMGLKVGIKSGHGLVCSIKWSRLGQAIELPVVMCPPDVVDADIGLLAVAIPWLTYTAVEFGLLRPRERRRQRQAIAAQRKRLEKLVARRRNESLQAIELMSEQVKRRQEKEKQRGGLVILAAEYGHSPTVRRSARNKGVDTRENMIDVTIPIAALVDQGQLVLSRKVSKSHILGFSDPAPLKPKILRIRYLFADRVHTVEVEDSEGVMCPMKEHLQSTDR